MYVSLGLGFSGSRRGITYTVIQDATTFAGTITAATLNANNAQNRFGAANTASTLVEDGTANLHADQIASTLVIGKTYRLTAYIKQAGRVNCFIGYSGSGQGLNVDVNAMTITAQAGAISSASVTASTNGYAKCQFTFLNSSLTGTTIDFFMANAPSNLSYTGDGVSGMILNEIIVELLS